jgi:hypothetical protein
MKILLIVIASFAGVIALIWIVGALLPMNHVAARQAAFHQPPEALWTAIASPPNERDLTYETLESDPPRRLVIRIHDRNHNFGGTWTYEIAPAPSGALLRITERGEVYNPIFRFISRFVMGHTGTIDAALTGLAKKFNETIQVENYGTGSPL